MKIKAVYPGSFDPVTCGHIDLIRRGSVIFSELVVGVADNPRKNHLFTTEERLELIIEATHDIPNVTVVSFKSLLVDFAAGSGAKVILKGLRAVSDFDYELQMSLTNRRLASDIETVFMMASEEHSFVSSTLIKEIAELGGELSSMVPGFVERALKKRLPGR